MLTDSSRVTRSAGSIAVPPGRPLIHSAGSGSGSGSIRRRSAPAGPAPSQQVQADAAGDRG